MDFLRGEKLIHRQSRVGTVRFQERSDVESDHVDAIVDPVVIFGCEMAIIPDLESITEQHG